MPRDCSICALKPDLRAEVEVLAAEKGHREAGRHYKLSYQAIGRHLAPGHLRRPNAKEDELDEQDEAGAEVAAVPQQAEALPEEPAPAIKAAASTDPSPSPPNSPRRAPVLYKDRYPMIAAITSMQDRKRYLTKLFAKGQFHGLRTSEHLSQIWDDLGMFEFAELVSQAAIEADFRRGSGQARRATLLGKVEKLFKRAFATGDLKTAANILKTWAQLDGVTLEADALAALASSQAWRIASQVLQRHPSALADVHAALSAEDSRKRAVLAPVIVQTDPLTAE